MPSPAPSAAPVPARFDVVVPVKRLDHAKTRLAPLGDDLRRALVVSFVRDVLAAVSAAPSAARVAVVTGEPLVAAAALEAHPGALVVPDPRPAGLNAALHAGAGALSVGGGAGEVGTGLLALCADLPAVTAAAIEAALAGCPVGRPGAVRDLAGTGTTAYVVAHPELFAPRFGPDSWQEHRRRGAADLTALAPPELRADVDTPGDLRALLGRLGPHTRDVLAQHVDSPLLA